jgi:Cof subfamily protein (haloacid dehalogenase superfamily)
MNKFKGILICTDLDGTLLRNDKSISRENSEAIEYFKSEGGKFTFITGRMPYFSHKAREMVGPNAPIGCANGGGIYDFEASEYVYKRVLPREALELVEYAEKNVPGIGISVYTFERIYFSAENEAMAEFRAVTGVENAVKPYREIDEPLTKVVFGDINPEKLKRLEAILRAHPMADNFEFVSSEKILFEILPKGVNKGTVLPKLAEHLGIDIAKTVAIGDYNNDIPMLKAAHYGVAVANACCAAKEAANYHTVSNEESAIARVIADIESGKMKF